MNMDEFKPIPGVCVSRLTPGEQCRPQAEGRADAAIRFEQLGNDLTKTYNVDILCAYALSSFQGEEDQHVFQSICAEHSAVYSESHNNR